METNYTNLFSTRPLDRLEEIYQATMDVMDDDTLQAYCMTAKYNKSLCNDNFWLRRIKENNLELLLPYRSLYPSLQSFYFNVRKDACYIVGSLEDHMENPLAFNNINEAVSAFNNLVRQENRINNATPELDYTGLTSKYDIYIFFDNALFTEETILTYSIFNLNNTSANYINPNILDYPLLSHTSESLFCIDVQFDTNMLLAVSELTMFMLPFNSDSLRSLPIGSDFHYMLIGNTNVPTLRLIWTKTIYGIYLKGSDDKTIILVDTSLLDDTTTVEIYSDFDIDNLVLGNYLVSVVSDDVADMIDAISNNFLVDDQMGAYEKAILPKIITDALLRYNNITEVRELTDVKYLLDADRY